MRDLSRQIADLRAEQASAWVTTLNHGKDDHRRAFLQWMQESPLNVREFLVAYSIDQSLGRLDAKRQLDVETLLAQADVNISRLPTGQAPMAVAAPRNRRPRRLLLCAAAAGVAVTLLIGIFAKFGRQTDWQEFRTGVGQQDTLNLEDGSIIHLSPRSSIAIRVSSQERVVKLIEGEALFDVHHDTQRPFRVLTPDAVIKDLGTLFNVYSGSDGVKVAVIEGSVSVAAGGNSRMSESKERVLGADQEANVDHRGVITIGQSSGGAKGGNLEQPRLIYRNETLKHIVEDFNRHGRKFIELDGDAVKGRSYTGVFNTGDPDSLALVLERDPDLIVERREDRIIVRAR
jgi:transmembrane sensor